MIVGQRLIVTHSMTMPTCGDASAQVVAAAHRARLRAMEQEDVVADFVLQYFAAHSFLGR